LKFKVYPHGQGGKGDEPVQTKGRGSIFSWFCAEVFYGWSL